MSDLISGKEALIALANGEEVEGNIGHGWYSIPLDKDVLLNSFVSEKNRNGADIKFRLKPRTITINGIEVPAPFKPDCETTVYIIDDGRTCGYKIYKYDPRLDSCNVFFGLWCTEEEIKQVVAALRSIFNETQ